MMSASCQEEVSSAKSTVSSEEHEEHLRLAGVVKGVHADLRKKFRNSKLHSLTLCKIVYKNVMFVNSKRQTGLDLIPCVFNLKRVVGEGVEISVILLKFL